MRSKEAAAKAKAKGTQALLTGFSKAAGAMAKISPVGSSATPSTPAKIIESGAINRSGSIPGPIWRGTYDPYLGISGSN